MLLKWPSLNCFGVLLMAACGTSVASEPLDSGFGAVDAQVLPDEADATAERDSLDDAIDATIPRPPVAMQVLPAEFTVEDAPLRMLTDGDAIDLWRAPQGGHVVLVAAKVRHFPSTAATLRVRVWNPVSGIILAEEKRTVAMVPVPDEPDTAQPDLRSRSQVSHVPLCPNYDAEPIVNRALEVEVQITALYTDPPQQAVARLHVVPACSQEGAAEQALCACECGASYTLGKCRPDSGTAQPDAGAAPSDAGSRELTDRERPDVAP